MAVVGLLAIAKHKQLYTTRLSFDIASVLHTRNYTNTNIKFPT